MVVINSPHHPSSELSAQSTSPSQKSSDARQNPRPLSTLNPLIHFHTHLRIPLHSPLRIPSTLISKSPSTLPLVSRSTLVLPTTTTTTNNILTDM
ncbi:hypothetical protein Pcinc_023701 [Petrolisthes cinctipes]|uniref:Uncharacterized protein n=1 Tax=Petrolisthes cinctipes TaxID=88211 RepID=A0AAE1FBB1_PETCI|nr:hypothetical protein Pcinc_023701 [Petrolisthes cinctipes]